LEHFRGLTAACGQAALQHHRQPSLYPVGATTIRPQKSTLDEQWKI